MEAQRLLIIKVLQIIPMNRLADLLSPNVEEWHESVFTTLMSLTKAGESRAIEKMFASGLDKVLMRLLEDGSEVAQHHVMITLKTFYLLGGPLANRSIRPGTLNLLPWQAMLSLEKFVLTDKNIWHKPKMPNMIADADESVPFFWGTNYEENVVLSDDAEVVKKAFGKSFPPYPKDLVILALVGSFFSTLLITPTTTV